LVEDEFNPGRILDLDQLVQNFQAEGIEIVKHRASFKNQLRGSAQLYDGTQQLQDLKPREVFEKRLEHEDYDDETKALLQEAFDEILEEIQNAD
jgi:exonuclease SbcD